MFSITAGTLNYAIPLPYPYKLKQGFPLVIKENTDWIIECSYFDEYGYGKTYTEALTDLGNSLVDFWQSLAKLIKQNKGLGDNLKETFNRLNENIMESS